MPNNPTTPSSEHTICRNPANLGVNPGLTITAMVEHAMSHIAPKKG